ncbi:hypothetical protein M7I_4055 [Glarea lozoyensis 74030]|uniref:DUF7053 domain-containing protein n=1 Tax=Glarea lozoyensis (strain ATCC 74030 / MF5533) TaxID=1104152 RepID=H0EN52_GLAL7|nr:hypothetical protein M7I_4055 [Glarea lozoyensis 74030]
MTLNVIRPLAPAVSKASALALLHDFKTIIALNPLIKSYKPVSSPVAFYKSVPADLKPSSTAELEALSVLSVIENSAPPEGTTGATWRGGWTKAFVPSELSYESSFQHLEDGGMILTHAPMGVNSVTTWKIEQGDEGLMVNMKLVVNSNKMLMAFIKTTLQDSVEKLVDDFLKAVEKVQETGKVVMLQADGSRIEV